MKNKQAKQMISYLVGNGAEWLNNWNYGSSTLIYMYQFNEYWYTHSYVIQGTVSLTADQLRGIK